MKDYDFMISDKFLYKLSCYSSWDLIVRDMLVLKALSLAVVLCVVSGKIAPVIYEGLEMCVPPEERANKFDYSELEFITESDTVVYLNGSWTFLEEVSSPWKSVLLTERFVRGQWVLETFQKKIDDFCAVIQDPLAPWYKITSKFEPKHCPFPKGVSTGHFWDF